MSEIFKRAQDVLTFWNHRSAFGRIAGTRDLIAKQLEIEAISSYIRDGMNVLDLGCGNGLTAIEIACRYDVDLLGIDFAEQMIAAARSLVTNQPLKGRLRFEVGDVRNPAGFTGQFDLIYTERVLINLPDWATQKLAIESISDMLSAGGMYVMCENSQDGLDRINDLRQSAGLSRIAPPWHNRYLIDSEIDGSNFAGLKLVSENNYSSTYYFLSRVVNAWIATEQGKEPEYDSKINQLALLLPPLGNFGQGKIWLWRKT